MEKSIRSTNTSPHHVRITNDTRMLKYSIPNETNVLLNPYTRTKPVDIPNDLKSDTSRSLQKFFESHLNPNDMNDFQPKK